MVFNINTIDLKTVMLMLLSILSMMWDLSSLICNYKVDLYNKRRYNEIKYNIERYINYRIRSIKTKKIKRIKRKCYK